MINKLELTNDFPYQLPITSFGFSDVKENRASLKKRSSYEKPGNGMTSSPVAGSVPIPLHNRYSPIAMDDDGDQCIDIEEEEFPMPKTRKRKRFLASRKGIYGQNSFQYNSQDGQSETENYFSENMHQP